MEGRYVCIHGHFYQPPRENPWLEAIEQQDSAHPYHDWNERITDECYAPNAAARILDGEGRIVRITNNYARISFNVGPTLLAWLEAAQPDTYAGIVAADRESAARFGGHGSALAQAYNHMILPLATRRDKATQIRWGIADFARRFGRAPEGMWLPETAVDLESLDLLAGSGIRFAVLAPHQAARVRRITGGRGWRDVGGSRIDPTRAYQCRLPSGRTIALFFYDGPISRAVAFERLLNSGEGFARRIADAFHDARTWPQLAQGLFADGSLEEPFLAALARAESNLPEHGDGRRIYEALVRPAMVDREDVGAHYAISSLFTAYPERAPIYCFEVERQDYHLQEAGRTRLAMGRARIVSTITRRSDDLSFAVLHLGDHTLNGGVRPFQGDEPYQAMLGEMAEAFSRTDFPAIIRLMDRHFGESNYSLGSLFRDEQRKVLHRILETQLLEIERDYRHIYEQHAPLMHYLSGLGAPLPRTLAAAAELVLNAELRRVFLDDAVEPARVRQLLAQVREYRLPLDTATLEFILRLHLERLAEAVLAAPEDPAALERFAASVELAAEMPVSVNLWKVQNLYYTLLQTAYSGARARAEAKDDEAARWAERFARLAGTLAVRADGATA